MLALLVAQFRRLDLAEDALGDAFEALAFTAGYAPGSGPDVLRAELAGEAIRLARVLRSLLPSGDAELDALLALMLIQPSHRDARVDGERLVLLPDQDRSRWRHDEITEALDLLKPLTRAPAAPYLLQALIAAEHAVAPSAELLLRIGWQDDARRSFEAAIALCDNEPERRHLTSRLAEV